MVGGEYRGACPDIELLEVVRERNALYITVKTQAEIDHDQYYIGEQEVYVGADITVRTKGFTGYMTVVDLQEVQADE